MPAFSATAPGKIILFGEHAVVYGRPAIAVPVTQVQARVVVMVAPRGRAGEVRLEAPQVGLAALLEDLPPTHPLAQAVRGVLAHLEVARPPACTLRISSTIPVAAGLGSGAAVSVAAIRAFAAFLGQSLPLETVSALAFEVEKLHHGTPSGIDNTVITYARPVYFMKDQALEILAVPAPFTLVIGDTGIASPTSIAVGGLRQAWQADPQPYEALFDAAGRIAQQARQAIEQGQTLRLGPWMDENHALLQKMGVSSPELDHLVESARQAGALGAKLSGGGRGGNMIALVVPELASAVSEALAQAGAVRTLVTEVKAG